MGHDRQEPAAPILVPWVQPGNEKNNPYPPIVSPW